MTHLYMILKKQKQKNKTNLVTQASHTHTQLALITCYKICGFNQANENHC